MRSLARPTRSSTPDAGPSPVAAGPWATLLLLAFISGCSTRAVGGSGALLYFRMIPRESTDLWLQSLDGKVHRPLTSSGEVVLLAPSGSPLGHWGGAAISPDGRRVAYVELQRDKASTPSTSRPPIMGWNALFVVSTDGTARRKLVDLTQHPLLQTLPQGQVRGGDILWSDDGRNILFVLELPAKKDNGWNCPQVTLQSVNVESGLVTPLSEVHPLGVVTPLGWAVARGEVFLYGACSPLPVEDVPIAYPIPKGHFSVLRLGDGTLRQQSALAPSLSPEGTFVFIPSQPRTQAPPAIYRTESLSLAWTLSPELPARYEARFIWLRHSPTALVSAILNQWPPVDCTGGSPQPQLLFRFEMDTGLLRRVREKADALNVVSVSPDDSYVLVGLPTGGFSTHSPCGRSPHVALHLVRRDDLESELPIEELRRRATPLTSPRKWQTWGAFPEYVGWVR